ncbi:MAG: hypothetical protein IJ068_02380 [Bacilli bacterium]|nr:hypothetical protein [Bacilli bacterium]
MEEKIYKLRNELISKLNEIEEGVHIKLNYDARILESIIFKTGDNECIVDEYGNRKQCGKYFALPKEILKKIDFSNIDFTNFNAAGFDFNGLYNVKLNPQTIWKKDLTGAKLNGVEFIGSFDDVILNGLNSGYVTDFSGSRGAIIDVSKVNKLFDEHVFLNDCKFQGVTFTYPFKCLGIINIHGYRFSIKPHIHGSDFTGSTGALIYPNEIENGLERCVLTDATLATPLTIRSWCMIKETNFKGVKQKGNILKRNKPLEITFKNLYSNSYDFTNTNFNGVYFKEPLPKGSLLNNTNFKGSTGAIIDLRIIDEHSNFKTCNFTDTKVIGDDGKEMTITEDGKLSHNFLYELDNFFGIDHTKELKNKEELEEIRKELINKKREEIFNKINEVITLTKSLETLGIEPNHLYGTIPITEQLLLVKVDDHLEINRDIIDASLIRFFNLSLINFSNVKVTGIDFRKSKAKIEPQIVYQKDISGCKFDDFNISPFTNFDGVNTENADFSECSFKILKK